MSAYEFAALAAPLIQGSTAKLSAAQLAVMPVGAVLTPRAPWVVL